MIRKGLFILIGIMTIASASLALQPIYADDGITIETDSDVYDHSSMIILTGHITVVDQNEVPVVIDVRDLWPDSALALNPRFSTYQCATRHDQKG